LCKKEFKISSEERAKTIACSCGAEAKNIFKAAHVKVMERLDNGIMIRRVERIHNIEEILEERADKHSEAFDIGPKDDE
jgi:hypothetical protein